MIQLLRKGGREEPQSTQSLSPPSTPTPPPSTPTPPPSTPTSPAQSSFCSGSLGLFYLLFRQLQNNVVPSHHLSQNAFLPLQESALGTLFCVSTSSPERRPTVPAPSWAWPWQRLRGVPSGVQLSASAVKGDVKPPETPQEAVGDFTSTFM